MTRIEPVHEVFMRRALKLAAKHRPSPNPKVGAVVVKGGVVVGEGAHQYAGGPHAEVVALAKAGEQARGADLYVTLEPCCHWGRTPPCTDAVIAAGIARVIIGMKDPDAKVAGKGIEKLTEAGIEVVGPVLEEECARINRAYIYNRKSKTGLVWVTLKLAMSLDGRIATRTGDSKWITGEKSRAYVQKLRANVDAILIGANTARIDNPRLTARLGKKTLYPKRVILSSDCNLPTDLAMFSEPGETIVMTTGLAPAENRQRLEAVGASVIAVQDDIGQPYLDDVLKTLGEMGCLSVLIEGGGELAASFIEDESVCDVAFFYGPVIIGGKDAVPGIGGVGEERMATCPRLSKVTIRRLGEDFLLTGEIGGSPEFMYQGKPLVHGNHS